MSLASGSKTWANFKLTVLKFNEPNLKKLKVGSNLQIQNLTSIKLGLKADSRTFLTSTGKLGLELNSGSK